jgi:hypothetical protein
MPVSATIIELELLVLSPSEAAPYPSVSQRSPSRLTFEGKIEARKHGPRTLVSPASHRRLTTRRLCSAAALTRCRVRLRNRGTDAPMRRVRT